MIEWRDEGWPVNVRRMAADMLRELRHSRFSVDLLPAPDSRHHRHYVRVYSGDLPQWYRDILASRPLPCRAMRKHPTSSYKRGDVLRWLTRIADNRRLHPSTAETILPVVEQQLEELEMEEEWFRCIM